VVSQRAWSLLGHQVAYPGKFASLLASPAKAREAIASIRDDWDRLLHFEQLATKNTAVADFLNKAAWSRLPAVRLIFCLFERGGWALDEDLDADATFDSICVSVGLGVLWHFNLGFAFALLRIVC
jgi:hypothetical protein